MGPSNYWHFSVSLESNPSTTFEEVPRWLNQIGSRESSFEVTVSLRTSLSPSPNALPKALLLSGWRREPQIVWYLGWGLSMSRYLNYPRLGKAQFAPSLHLQCGHSNWLLLYKDSLCSILELLASSNDSPRKRDEKDKSVHLATPFEI